MGSHIGNIFQSILEKKTDTRFFFIHCFNERNHLSKIVNSLNQYHNKNMYAINILQSEFLVQKSGCLVFLFMPQHESFLCLHMRLAASLIKSASHTVDRHSHTFTHTRKTDCKKKNVGEEMQQNRLHASLTADRFPEKGKEHAARVGNDTRKMSVQVLIYKSVVHEPDHLVPCWLLCVCVPAGKCSSGWTFWGMGSVWPLGVVHGTREAGEVAHRVP